MARSYELGAATPETDAAYKKAIKRNVSSLSALARITCPDESIPLSFIESVAESLAFQESLVAHYKSHVAVLQMRERKARRDRE